MFVSIHDTLHYIKICMCYTTDRPTRPTVTLMTTKTEGEPAAPIATCSTSGFSPRNINVTWQLEGTPATQDKDAIIQPMDNILFSISSNFSHAVDRADNGKTLTCTVYHPSLSKPLSHSVAIPVFCKYFLHSRIFEDNINLPICGIVLLNVSVSMHIKGTV